MAADDAQRLGESERVARVADRGEVRRALALAAERGVDHGRSELHQPQPAAQCRSDEDDRRGA